MMQLVACGGEMQCWALAGGWLPDSHFQVHRFIFFPATPLFSLFFFAGMGVWHWASGVVWGMKMQRISLEG